MEVSICFSQYFVDKQNARSFSNIIKPHLLKNEDAFLRHIFKDNSILKDLSSDLLQVFSSLKTNLKEKSKQDFKNYFVCDKINVKDLHILNKLDIFNGCWKAMNDIIPRSFYGNISNERIFQKFMQLIIYSMRRQHINIEQNVRKWDYSLHPWKSVSGNSCANILYYILVWIFQYILSTIISLNFYVTTCKLDGDEYKLYFYWKYQWQSFYDRKIVNMLRNEVINRFENYCSGKKVKRIHSYNKKAKLKTIRKDIPKLHLTLKTNNDCRPIVRYKNNILSTSEKYKIKNRLYFLKALTGKVSKKIENKFTEIYRHWVRLNKPKLYFVKADLSNAFGSIDRNILLKILDERYRKYLKTEKYTQQYKDMIEELRKPILVRAGSTVFVWKKGLVQGYKYSPALSELYYTHMDEIFFSEHLQEVETGIRLFSRVVDDYLYITDSLDDAQSFLKALSGYKNVNYDKTVINFPHSSIKFSDQITFLGYTYDTLTMHVSRASSVYSGQLCYKIAFTQAITDVYKFLEQRVGQSSIQINGHLFNLYRNSDEAVWTHIFTTLCLSANKFCTILAILCDTNEMRPYLTVYKKRVTVKLCNSIIDTLLKNKPEDYNFLYCINHFRYLSWKALMLCAQQTPKCNGLVPYVSDELSKSNCIFGKWKEHARRIGTDGKCLRPAVKEVCRRTDWRQIMKKFVTLPNGFQCYHHKNMIKPAKTM